MDQEPVYLIGGPAAPEAVATPKKLAAKLRAAREESQPCIGSVLPQRVPGAALVTEPAPEIVAPQEVFGLFRGYDAAHWTQEAKLAEGSLDFGKRRRAKEYELCAELAKVNGIMDFPALFTVGGAPVPHAVLVPVRPTGRLAWRMGTGKAVSWFNPSQDPRGAVRAERDGKKGFLVGLVRTGAHVGTKGNGSAWIEPDPQAPVEILDNGSKRTQYQDW